MTWSVHDRPELLDRMTATPVDVLVVGAGITGAGIALDAAARGYRVAIVERDDVASGTSSKSSKLVHGGVRYLATGDLPMVLEGVRERECLRRLAPHLVRPLGFVVPTGSAADVAMLRVGLLAYDAMALGGRARAHRRLSHEQVLLAAPGLARGASHGGFSYDDAQTDDARLTLAILQAARHHGALACTHLGVTHVEPRAGARPNVVTLRDHLDGSDHEVRARWVVGAGGVWADRIGDVAPGTFAPELQPARGSHLVLHRADVPVNRAVVVPSASDDGRRLFLVPWGDQVYVGTTDDADVADGREPAVDEQDAAYLLAAVNRAFATDLRADDAIGAWAGWRPLVAGGPGTTGDLSRRHLVHEPAPGVVTVTGGKLTTYRRMAADAVDVLVAGDGIRRESTTTRIPLGATGAATDGVERTRHALADAGGLPSLAAALYHRHGDEAGQVAQFAADHGELDRLCPGLPYLVGEVRWAARREMAVTLDDVLSRRLRVAIRDAGAGGAAIEAAAGILADELGWDDPERARQVADYRDRVATERGPIPLR